MRHLLLVALALVGSLRPAAAQPVPGIAIAGAPEIVFSARRDGCEGIDTPDAPLRAYRDAAGRVVLFGLHYENRALRGDGLERVRIDCRVVLGSAGRGDPAAYDDKSWITATWTDDGRNVHALVHHEFQANRHPGRCRFPAYMPCWYNTVLGVASSDGGATFVRPSAPRVVAAAPFPQEVGQGRHRGFFNPSNIVSDGRWRYVFVATTGWDGQPYGACLLRTDDPADPTSWRAFDGRGFTIRYGDPYREKALKPAACKPIAPFPAPVGAVVRHRGTGLWVAVFQAWADGAAFPQPGFYVAASRDLLAWSPPRLLLAGKTLYNDACKAEGPLVAYPSLLDRGAKSRNFEDVGDEAELYYALMPVKGCEVTADRDLVRRRVTIRPTGAP
jgi:hypothetical protein